MTIYVYRFVHSIYNSHHSIVNHFYISDINFNTKANLDTRYFMRYRGFRCFGHLFLSWPRHGIAPQ